MGDGKRVRNAYRVLGAVKGKNPMPMLGFSTWRVTVERMSAAAGRAEIAAGMQWRLIVWDRRG